MGKTEHINLPVWPVEESDISHELGAIVTRMHENLDTALTRLNELDAQTANREGIAVEIRQELIGSGQRWPFRVTLAVKASPEVTTISVKSPDVASLSKKIL